MITINILCVGKIKEQYLKDAIIDYSKRLSKYCNLNIIEVPDEIIPEKSNDSLNEIIKNNEAKKILLKIPKDTYLICMDLKGKEYSSTQFSEKIESLGNYRKQ